MLIAIPKMYRIVAPLKTLNIENTLNEFEFCVLLHLEKQCVLSKGYFAIQELSKHFCILITNLLTVLTSV